MATEISLKPVIPVVKVKDIDDRVVYFLDKLQEESKFTVRNAINNQIVNTIAAAEICDLIGVINNATARGPVISGVHRIINTSSYSPFQRELLMDNVLDIFTALDVYVALELESRCDCKPKQPKSFAIKQA